MAKQLFHALFISVFLMLSACSTNTKEIPGDVISEDYEGDINVDSGSKTTGLKGESDLSVEALDNSGLASGKMIYFDYNSIEIHDDSLPLITSAAETLTTNPTIRIRLEGHADERGTREYNLALGERRAQSVRELIMLQGANDNQIDVVSYGEEKPAVVGSDEQSWQQNRRVELIY